MKRFKTNNKKPAQQLVEFLLIVPFMVTMLGILTEYAYALNINMTLNEGLKTSVSSIYSQIKPGMTAANVNTLVSASVTKYLSDNNAPTLAENNLKVSYRPVGQSTVFMASYTYFPAFTLPNVFFKIMPSQFLFFATSSVPTAFLAGTSAYSTGISSTDLDAVWKGSNFSGADTYDGVKNGVMKDTAGRANMIFLVPNPSLGANKFSIVHWNGTVDNCSLDSSTGLISGGGCGSYNGGNIMNYLTGNNYYNIMFVHDDNLSSLSADLSDLSTYWAVKNGTAMSTTDVGSADLSDMSIVGILKNSLALFDSNNYSIGNYDNIAVSVYNLNVSKGNIYNLESFGSMTFLYSSDDLSKIVTGSIPKKDYDFGS